MCTGIYASQDSSVIIVTRLRDVLPSNIFWVLNMSDILPLLHSIQFASGIHPAFCSILIVVFFPEDVAADFRS